MRFQSYFNTAIKIIDAFDAKVPLQHYLKQYFSQHKKHGSKDRKFITHLCYSYFRLGKSLLNIPAEERLKLAIFICNDDIDNWKFLYEDEWLNKHTDLLNERIAFAQEKYTSLLQDVFPFLDETSKTLNADAFATSFFIQPDVFVRIRPGYDEKVKHTLQQHNIPYNTIEENCISLSPSTSINTILNIDEEVVVQDYSSQQVKRFLETVEEAVSHQLSATSKTSADIKNRTSQIVHRTSVWDCCAGSGGKSILAYDVLKSIDLTATDIRSSIIQNLKQRFAKAGIKNYTSFVFDAANAQLTTHNAQFDLIICDVPCTGSGTWSRTPEQLYFFEKENIEIYASRQQKIVRNAIRSLKNNGQFLYITCSVFEKENEAIAAFIRQKFGLALVKMELIKGYDKKADSMFAALFRKN